MSRAGSGVELAHVESEDVESETLLGDQRLAVWPLHAGARSPALGMWP